MDKIELVRRVNGFVERGLLRDEELRLYLLLVVHDGGVVETARLKRGLGASGTPERILAAALRLEELGLLAAVRMKGTPGKEKLYWEMETGDGG